MNKYTSDSSLEICMDSDIRHRLDKIIPGRDERAVEVGEPSAHSMDINGKNYSGSVRSCDFCNVR